MVEDGAPVGVVTDGMCQDVDRFTQLSQVMAPDPLTIPAGTDLPKIFDVLSDARVSAAPVVEGDRLVGVITRKGALRSALYTPAVNADGDLLTSAAVGINGDVAGKAARLARRRASTSSSWTPRTATRRRRSRPCGPCGRSPGRPRSSRATW